MKAVVYKEPFNVAVEVIENAKIQDPTDVVIQLTMTASAGQICTQTKAGPGPRRVSRPGFIFSHENQSIEQKEELGRPAKTVDEPWRVQHVFLLGEGCIDL
jgi:glutathione-independent formaldehyde dehydrogenase